MSPRGSRPHEHTSGDRQHPQDRKRRVDRLLPLQQPDRGGGPGGHPPLDVPPGTRGVDGGRRLQPAEQPESVRRRHHPGRPGRRERHGGTRPGVRRQRAHPLFRRGAGAQPAGRGPNFSPVRTYQTVSVSAEVIWKPDMAAAVLRRAFHRLRNGRPGPVIVEVPNDVGTQEVPAASLSTSRPSAIPRRPAPAPCARPSGCSVGQEAPDPIGDGNAPGRGHRRAPRARRVLDIPVYCTMPGKSGFDERHPLALGSGSGATGRDAGRGSRSVTSSWLWARASPAPAMGSRSRTARS